MNILLLRAIYWYSCLWSFIRVLVPAFTSFIFYFLFFFVTLPFSAVYYYHHFVSPVCLVRCSLLRWAILTFLDSQVVSLFLRLTLYPLLIASFIIVIIFTAMRADFFSQRYLLFSVFLFVCFFFFKYTNSIKHSAVFQFHVGSCTDCSYLSVCECV